MTQSRFPAVAALACLVLLAACAESPMQRHGGMGSMMQGSMVQGGMMKDGMMKDGMKDGMKPPAADAGKPTDHAGHDHGAANADQPATAKPDQMDAKAMEKC